MKIYVSKYALTEGILEMSAEECGDGMSVVRGNMSEGTFDQYFHGNDWHTTREAAVARAEEMRKKKIVSIQKSLKKLQAMKF